MRLISFASSTSDPWIGLIKNNTHQYYWSDNWPVEWTNWGEGWESAENERCGFILSSDGTWNATSCLTEKSFICKISSGLYFFILSYFYDAIIINKIF